MSMEQGNQIEAELAGAIEELYRVFSRYPRPRQIKSCPCGCTKPEETAPLLAYTVRELPFDKMENYAFSAMTTQGALNDFRYFLPRLLERLSTVNSRMNPQVVVGKLAYEESNWRSWPADEIEAIDRWFSALWRVGLASFPIENRLPDFCNMEDLLNSIAVTGQALAPYLQRWSETQSESANRHIALFVLDFGPEFANGGTIKGAGWKYSAAQGASIREWILTSGILDRAEACCYPFGTFYTEQQLLEGLKILRAEGAICGASQA
jgi:hypothetical protein